MAKGANALTQTFLAQQQLKLVNNFLLVSLKLLKTSCCFASWKEP
jgi:hypothetical protein